jgi:hypothetical protein
VLLKGAFIGDLGSTFLGEVVGAFDFDSCFVLRCFNLRLGDRSLDALAGTVKETRRFTNMQHTFRQVLQVDRLKIFNEWIG